MSEYFNILSIDGGGIRGLIPGQFLIHVEIEAYNYAKSKGYKFPTYLNKDKTEIKKMAIKDLFDMTAGTSTGSIIAAGMVMPKPLADGTLSTTEPKFWAEDIIEIYTTKGNQIFDSAQMESMPIFGFTVAFIIFFALVGFCCGRKHCDSQSKRNEFENIRLVIEATKKNHFDAISKEAEKSKTISKQLSMQKTPAEGALTKTDTKNDDSYQAIPKAKRKGATYSQAKQGIINQSTTDSQVEKPNVAESAIFSSLQTHIKTMVRGRDPLEDMQIFKEKLEDGHDDSKEIGAFIQELDIDSINHMENMLFEATQKYERKRACKWVCLFVFILLGFIVGLFVPPTIQALFTSRYNRDQLENLMDEYLGQANISQALTKEVLIVAYDYNSQEPRFYSKFFAKHDPAIYEVKMSDATGASSAAPTYFTPKIQKNSYGLTEYQIDGGVICNNPALYAYNIASVLRQEKKKIRVLSLGTGEKNFTKLPADIDVKAYLTHSDYFMMQIDMLAADNYLKQHFEYTEKRPQDYVRLQVISPEGMDDISKKALKGLVENGETMWSNNKADVMKLIQEMVDDKFGPKSQQKK